MKKVYVEVKIGLLINAEDKVNIDDVLGEMDYNFMFDSDKADIVETEILSWEIKDSK
jgi:hypothetical protein